MPPEVQIFTIARGTFDASVSDVREILDVYDRRPKRSDSWRHVDGEALLRAAVILTATAWETFIEDTLTGEFAERIDAARDPQEVASTFNYCAQRWLEGKPQSPTLADWTGDGWKAKLRLQCEAEVGGISNPSAKRTREAFERFLNHKNVTASWRWRGVSPQRACKMLDDLLEHRGALAHRGRPMFQKRSSVTRRDAQRYLDLVCQLVRCTELAIGTQPR